MTALSRRLVFLGAAALLAVAVPAAVVFTAFKAQRNDPAIYPSYADQAAIDFFHSHRSEFEALRSVIEQHPLIFLDAEGENVAPPAAFREASEAKGQILRLMKALGLQGVNGVESDWGVRLIFLFSPGVSKSFHYSARKPENLVPKIDRFSPNKAGSGSVCRPIADGWYLHFEWGG